ncbi:unnamed protein product [Rodentolepis nana]|uniref:Non-specific serine/threonine protein kinase n=1 Tax=Rodentolepis nana TaxID=102285 RepID=A0A0R3TPT7_RODNA|nr:unnamed protein product [Rodentolepis nana]
MENLVNRYLDGLKSNSDETRLSTVSDLRKFIASDLKEAASSNYTEVIDYLCVELNEMLNGCLAEIDFASLSPYCPKFIASLNSLNYLGDLQLIVLSGRLLGEFGLLLPNDFAESQIRRACESLKSCSLSFIQKEFNILMIREAALHTPVSFYHSIAKCLPVLLQCFREKEIVLRDLSAMALRCTLGIAAENEIGRQGQRLAVVSEFNVNSFGDQLTRSLPPSSSRQVLRGMGNTPFRKSVTIQQPSLPSANEPPVSWYTQCVSQLLFPQIKAVALKPSDVNVPPNVYQIYKKMTKEEWSHGSLLILNELLVYANPEFEKLRSSLDSMLEQPIFHAVITNQTEGETAVLTVGQTQWPVVINLNQADISPLPGSTISALTSSNQIFGDEGVASELLRQQQFRQQRAVPLVSEACQRVLGSNLAKIWELVLSCFTMKHTGVLHLVMKVIPRLVALAKCPILTDVATHTLRSIIKSSEGNESVLVTAVNFLFDCVNRDKEKGYALITLGLMTYAAGEEFLKRDYVNKLVEILKNELKLLNESTSTKKKSGSLSTAILLTLGLIACNLGSSSTGHIKGLLDTIISRGLSQPLSITCALVAEHIPELKRDVQEGLLKRINVILANTTGIGIPGGLPMGMATGITPGSPIPGSTTVGAHRLSIPSSRTTPLRARHSFVAPPFGQMRTSAVPLPGFPWGEAFSKASLAFGEADPSGDAPTDSQLVTVALKTLGNFDFEGYKLASFVRHTAQNFISINSCGVREIRLEGVRTCLRLMLPLLNSADHVPGQMQKELDAVSEVLAKLLIVGISDPDSEVRKCVFSMLDSQFDNLLAQSRHLNSLFVALNDEVFAIRGLVMQCLGRLSDVNPACVQPTLRCVLLKIITDLSDSGTAKNKEEAAALIAILAATAPHFVVSYGESLLHVIIPQIRNALPINLRMKLLILRNDRLQKAGKYNRIYIIILSITTSLKN